MSPQWVILVYGSSVASALLLLYLFRARSWYWHVISVLLALVVGLVPMPKEWQSPRFDLLVGFLFIFLLFWGAGAVLFRTPHQRKA